MSRRKRRAVAVNRPASTKFRIDRTAYDLFSRHGIRAVGVDTIVARSGVSKMTLYRHYRTKGELALAFFEQRWDRFSRRWQSAVEALGLPPSEALLAVFDVLDQWYRSPDYAGCPVVKALLESPGPDDRVRGGALRYFASVRGFLRKLAQEAGLRDPDRAAEQWHMLVWGSIIGACAGDRDAAHRARELAAAMLESEQAARARHGGRARNRPWLPKKKALAKAKASRIG